MKKSELRQIIKEEISKVVNENTNDDFNQMRITLFNSKDKISSMLPNYKIYESSNMIRFSKNSKGIDSYISIEVTKLGDNSIKYMVFCETKIETSSVSLANPRLAYQNTSARRVTHKKIKDNKFVKDIIDVINIISKHITKINKHLT